MGWAGGTLAFPSTKLLSGGKEWGFVDRIFLVKLWFGWALLRLLNDLLSVLDIWIKIEAAMILVCYANKDRICGYWWSIFKCHSRKLDKSFLSKKSVLRNGIFPHNWFQWTDINVVQRSATSLESVHLNSITFGRLLRHQIDVKCESVSMFLEHFLPMCGDKEAQYLLE